MVLEYVNGGELFDKIVRNICLILLLHKDLLPNAMVTNELYYRHPKVNLEKLKVGRYSNSWLMVWASATVKVSSTGILRYFICLLKNCYSSILELELKLCSMLTTNFCVIFSPTDNLLQLENVLLDAKGNIKITDFNLSALPQHFRVRYHFHEPYLNTTYFSLKREN